MLGHLNQSVYHELLEEGRAALITEIVRRVGVDHAQGAFVLAHVASTTTRRCARTTARS